MIAALVGRGYRADWRGRQTRILAMTVHVRESITRGRRPARNRFTKRASVHEHLARFRIQAQREYEAQTKVRARLDADGRAGRLNGSPPRLVAFSPSPEFRRD